MSPARAISTAAEGSFVHVARLPGSETAARQAASRAARSGRLVPVRKGLYYRGRRTRYGMTAPRAEDVVRAVLGTRGVGPAGYSAARLLGLTTQVPASVQVAALRTAEPIAGVTQHHRSNLTRVDLNEKEIALLEVLRSPDVYVESGWRTLVDVTHNAITAGEIRVHRVRTAVGAERNASVRRHFTALESDLHEAA